MAAEGPSYNANAPSYPQLNAAPQYEAPPSYATVPNSAVAMQQPAQPQSVGNVQTRVVYVVQPQQQQPYAQVTQQPVTEGVATNDNPNAVVVQSVAVGIESGGDPNEYFRRKLSDPRMSCCCGGQGECCSLWVGAQVWLFIWILGNLYNIWIWNGFIQVYGSYAVYGDEDHEVIYVD
eukprot:291727_1